MFTASWPSKVSSRHLGRPGFATGAVLGIGLVAALAGPLQARLPLGYPALSKQLPGLWAKRFPVRALKFKANPEGRGVLAAIHKRRTVYYYHYQVTLPRSYRTKAGKLLTKTGRTLELWVRYRPHLKKDKRIDFSFVRRDLLPGFRRRWIKTKSRPKKKR